MAESQNGDTSASVGAIGARDDAKIIRTGSIDLRVSDVPKALRAARDGIVALGGYVGASNTANDGDQPTAEITYRIPADRWEDALDLLRGLNGLTTKVVAEHTEAVEVTGQVIDLQARITNLQASEVALQGIAERATKISDVLEVQAQLTDVRGQIEQLTAQLKDLNDRAGYATLTARFSVPIVATSAAAKGWEPGAVVDEAMASMISIVQSLANVGIWFVHRLAADPARPRPAGGRQRLGVPADRAGSPWCDPAATGAAEGADRRLTPCRGTARRGPARVSGAGQAIRPAEGRCRRIAGLPARLGAWHHAPMTEQAERYDRIAEGYAQWWAPVLAPGVASLLDGSPDRLVPTGAAQLIDIGTGTGQLALGAICALA